MIFGHIRDKRIWNSKRLGCQGAIEGERSFFKYLRGTFFIFIIRFTCFISCVLCPHVCMCTTWVLSAIEVRTGHGIPCYWSYGWLWAVYHVGTENQSKLCLLQGQQVLLTAELCLQPWGMGSLSTRRCFSWALQAAVQAWLEIHWLESMVTRVCLSTGRERVQPCGSRAEQRWTGHAGLQVAETNSGELKYRREGCCLSKQNVGGAGVGHRQVKGSLSSPLLPLEKGYSVSLWGLLLHVVGRPLVIISAVSRIQQPSLTIAKKWGLLPPRTNLLVTSPRVLAGYWRTLCVVLAWWLWLGEEYRESPDS